MRNVRAAVAAVTALFVVGGVSSMGAASAATTGVGTSDVSTTVVGVALGDDGSVLGVRLLGDDARSTIDPAVSAPAASSRLTGVEVSSDVVGALNLSSGVVESKQPGGDDSVTTGSVDLSAPADGVTIPETVLDGTLGAATLKSAAAPSAASSAVDAALTNAVVAGGLATVQGVTSSVDTAAVASDSSGVRSVKIDQVVVLDLGSLLAGLKISLADLPLDTLTDLLDKLGVSPDGFTNGDAVDDAVDTLQAQLTELAAQVTAGGTALPAGDTVGTIVDVINGTPLGTVVDPATETAIGDLTTVVEQLNALIDQAQGTIATIVDQVVSLLDSVALLEVDGVEVGVTTKAADTVENSVASVTAKIGGIKVGGKALEGVDVAQTVADVNATLATVNDTISDVLGTVDPGLADLIDVQVFQRAADHGVTSANGYVEAVDGITALTATITPPAALADIVSGIADNTGTVTDLLGSVGATDVVDGLAADMLGLNTEVNAGNAGALADGGSVTLASLESTSNFAPSLPVTPGSGTDDDRNMAATGAGSTLPLTALATLLIALGIGLREWVRMPLRRATR